MDTKSTPTLEERLCNAANGKKANERGMNLPEILKVLQSAEHHTRINFVKLMLWWIPNHLQSRSLKKENKMVESQ